MPSLSTITIGWLLSLSIFVNALPRISRSGKYLYNPDGERFYIKGIAYQPQGELAAQSDANAENGGFPEPSSFFDPLSDPANCTRDIPYLEQLGVNAIRVYSVNSSLNHDECMQALDAAGIYVMLDVSLPLNGSIDRSSPSWSTNLLNEYTTTIDAFRGYDNILAYNIGNEVINLPANTNAAPYVKAAARDIKAYLRGVNAETLVGYAAVDGEPSFRDPLADYLTCGDESIVVDLYGLNNYEWCGDSSYNASGWASIVAGFSEIPVASYMSEYGCIFSPPRLWTEVDALFSAPVTDVFSGGVAFSYFPTSDGYGMVTFSGDGNTVQTSADFDRLAAEYNSTTGPNSPAQSSQTQMTTECPAVNGSILASTELPPTPDESVCNCINQNAFACRVRPETASNPAIIGSLTDYACNLLGSSNSGATCDAIGGNGTSGVYGDLAFCSPEIKLSYVFSAYYEFNPVDSSCDFSGNATLSSTRPNTADDAASAASSCLAQEPSGGVFTPSATSGSNPTSSAPSSSGSGSGSNSGGGSSNSSNAAGRLGWDSRSMFSVGAAFGGIMIGGLAVL